MSRKSSKLAKSQKDVCLFVKKIQKKTAQIAKLQFAIEQRKALDDQQAMREARVALGWAVMEIMRECNPQDVSVLTRLSLLAQTAVSPSSKYLLDDFSEALQRNMSQIAAQSVKVKPTQEKASPTRVFVNPRTTTASKKAAK